MEDKIKGVAFKLIVKTSELIKETEQQGTAEGLMLISSNWKQRLGKEDKSFIHS